MVSAAAPAAAAYPTSTFSVIYTASYYNGTVTWYNRSVGIAGTFKASNCRRVYAEAWAGSTQLDYQSSSTWCNTSGPAPFSLDADVVGGADNIWIWMTTDDPDEYLAGQTCYRSGSCVDGRQ